MASVSAGADDRAPGAFDAGVQSCGVAFAESGRCLCVDFMYGRHPGDRWARETVCQRPDGWISTRSTGSISGRGAEHGDGPGGDRRPVAPRRLSEPYKARYNGPVGGPVARSAASRNWVPERPLSRATSFWPRSAARHTILYRYTGAAGGIHLTAHGCEVCLADPWSASDCDILFGFTLMSSRHLDSFTVVHFLSVPNTPDVLLCRVWDMSEVRVIMPCLEYERGECLPV